MIIECPKCQFSGRIPSYALESPYNARCPRCRFRFELHTLLADTADELLDDPEIDGLEAESGDGVPGDPGSSAYELKAITEDFGAGSSAAEDAEWRSDVPAESPSTVASGPVSGHGSGTTGVLGPRGWASEPWYSRVLQAWGVALLLWAALILVRSLRWTFTADGDASGPGHLVATVCCVVLLVPGAAALFLLVDLGRYLRARTPGSDLLRAEERELGPANALSAPLGVWGGPARLATGSRPQA